MDNRVPTILVNTGARRKKRIINAKTLLWLNTYALRPENAYQVCYYFTNIDERNHIHQHLGHTEWEI